MAAPVLAIGDGALGFWSAVRDTSSPPLASSGAGSTRSGNVLSALPKSAQPGAKKALAEIWQAEDRAHAETAAKNFADEYGAKWPKAVAKITDDLAVLLEFYDYPAEHWVHCAPPTRSSPRSPPCGCASALPRVPAPAPPASRWHSS